MPFYVPQEEKAKAYKKEKQKERKRRAEDDVDFEEDDEMAAVMGFSGFGSSKKSHWWSVLWGHHTMTETYRSTTSIKYLVLQTGKVL